MSEPAPAPATATAPTASATAPARVTAPFGERLDAAFRASGHLCVGIDPHPYLLDEWSLPRSAAGVRDFGLAVVAAAAGTVGIVKPQVAFFEAYGSAGFAALEEVLAAAREASLLVIGDAKRGDIGSTNDGYAAAWLEPGSPLEVDALTATAFTGVGALEGLFARATAASKGVFVLSATSNPESRALQTARTDAGDSVSKLVADEVAAFNTDRTRVGDLGLVLGATKRLDEYGFTSAAVRTLSTTPVLAPGFGFQGAEFSSIPSIFGQLSSNVIVSVSRSILAHGPSGLGAAIETEHARVGEVLL